MQHDDRESWADNLFWGVTIALAVLGVSLPLALYFHWWVPFGR